VLGEQFARPCPKSVRDGARRGPGVSLFELGGQHLSTPVQAAHHSAYGKAQLDRGLAIRPVSHVHEGHHVAKPGRERVDGLLGASRQTGHRVGRSKALGSGPHARVGREDAQRSTLTPLAPIARDEHAEQNLLGPSSEVRPGLVLGGEEKGPLDGVLHEVVGVRGVLGKTHRATRQVGDEARQTGGQRLCVVRNDGRARDRSRTGGFGVHRLPLGATEMPCREGCIARRNALFHAAPRTQAVSTVTVFPPGKGGRETSASVIPTTLR
jgi:hypothetical protein